MFDNLLFMTGKACSTSAAQGLAARRLFAAGGWPAHEQPAAGLARPTMLFRTAVSGITPRWHLCIAYLYPDSVDAYDGKWAPLSSSLIDALPQQRRQSGRNVAVLSLVDS